ncbi:ATP phosphoribosyltransferase regulatory subunit [Oceanobacillus massiliensis]|uniref:ATP phosphoribosyltransferase regulatory subunit n=1 Tax=Oceanobacillus massiliensis TaxID=1465765 RepID=UPI000289383B|nr:ATP phosphoribosyltransferase regulatory subunit [Oceanobacillus massiliensis]
MKRNRTELSRNKNVEDFQMRDDLITTLKKRFTTYGYKQVRTSTLEFYDMYSDITGTINKDEMVKVIDTSGKVLVLRPDVTIPITRITAANQNSNALNQRLFYVLDVFRQTGGTPNQKESTQAGVEFFGENTPEIDSEVIMLAIHTLKDLGFKNFKIEIGHAGFFKDLIQQASLTEQELELLQNLIQSKNMAEIEIFLDGLSIDSEWKSAIETIPMLYGEPATVIQQAEKIIRSSKMQHVLHNLIDVYEVLKDYGVNDDVIFNLGLINNMDYYTGVIFQGFVGKVGQPVLMGGRYDHLGEQFNHAMPAIGFAFEVDYLLQAIRQQGLSEPSSQSVDIIIYYTKEKQREALIAAYKLRNNDYQVLTFAEASISPKPIPAACIARFEKEQNLFAGRNNTARMFSDTKELTSLILANREDF